MTTPIRLVFCITELDPGGAERALTQLVTRLNRDDWEPHVICLGPRGHFADVLESANIPLVCLNARGAFSLPRVLFRLTQELRRLRPSLVQTFLFHANIAGRIAARLAGIHLVVSGLRVAEHRSVWYGRIDRWTNFLVAKNVCVSQGVAQHAERVCGLNHDKLLVIPNSVDVERFASAQPANLTEFGIPVGSRVFITIGRLERQKGIDVLLDAVDLLLHHDLPHDQRSSSGDIGVSTDSTGTERSANDPLTPGESESRIGHGPLPNDIHFLIVGDGPDERPLRDRSQQSSMSDRVHFAGRRDDVPNLLAASIALILPSRWEGMPNVVLEAMAAGRPVLATKVEGIAELVEVGVTGLVVTPEQPTELARAIQRFLNEKEPFQSGGLISQSIASKRFTIESVAFSYVELYRQLLPPKR